MNLLLPTLALAAHLCASDAAPLAGVALYNPTAWTGPALVEVPTGRIAAPGLIDWSRVRLVCDGTELPFHLREGRAHWRASLAPVPNPPRAEDLLVFWCPVPPGAWKQVDIVPGARADKDHLSLAASRDGGNIVVDFPEVRAVLGAASGLLEVLRVHGEDLLAGPMSASFQRADPESFATSGPIGPGYLPFQVAFDRGGPLPHEARLRYTQRTGAMTEVGFDLITGDGPAMALTYRFHADGLVEITADERPWTGTSPWLNAAATFALPLAGAAESLAMHEERAPFYGFKDYSAALDATGLWRGVGSVGVLELGEETVNGRRWQRRVFAWEQGAGTSREAAMEMLDEGLVVRPLPVRSAPLDRVGLAFPPEAATVAGELRAGLKAAGVDVDDGAEARVTLTLDGTDPALAADGYDIRADGKNVTLRGPNLLGLYRAVRAVAGGDASAGLPLVAGNPVVPLRGGGFGGGNFEVDFPYGTETEWKQVFDGLLDSGMNVFWCLGMWGNWKLPVTYQYMPELQSDSPEDYDEATGVVFSEAGAHREHGLRLVQYLHERGAPVYLWLPIGCVPTTFLRAHPQALKPGSIEEFWGRPKGTPCFTHPAYARYIDAFLRELVETYALDGVVLVRDDNGGICDCERCRAFVAASKTKSAAWEQYLQIYEALRGLGFEGAIGVYPYFDGYAPSLDPLLPEDLLVAGHGASLAGLARRHDRVGHMPDTWLDNLYTNFRLPSSPRVRRLLADRGTFWIGGAYTGTELPWEALGFFGWEPTATPNSLRYHWGARTFGADAATAFVALSDAYEALWDINARHLVPNVWMAMDPAAREAVTRDGLAGLETFTARLAALKTRIDGATHDAWLKHLELWPVFFEYHLRRMGRFSEVYDLVQAHRETLDAGGVLPEAARADLLAKYAEIYDLAERYRDAAAGVPGGMMESTRHMTMPYKEWMSGCDGWLDPLLERPQFRGEMAVPNVRAVAGRPFTVSVDLHNTGICPWVVRSEQHVAFSEAGQALGLPARWNWVGQPAAPGDRRTLSFTGTAPEEPGSAEVTVALHNPFRSPGVVVERTFTVAWEADRAPEVTRTLRDHGLWVIAPPKELAVDASVSLPLAGLEVTCAGPDAGQAGRAAETLRARLGATVGVGRPVRLAVVAEGGEVPPGIAAADLDGLGREGYALHIDAGGVSLAARDWPGLFHGTVTLAQLATDRASLPGLHLRDWPALRYRGAQQDICRGQVPTMETFYRLTDVLAESHQNVLELYIEHTFQWRSHPDISPPEGITPQEGRALFDYAAARHLEVHPLFQALGHSYHILNKPQYQHLRIGPCEKQPWIMTFDVRKPEAVALVNELVDELCEAFPGALFNVDITEIDCDGMLEQGMTLEELTDLVFQYVLQLDAMVKPHGMRLMIAQGPLDSTGHLAGMGPKLDQLPRDIIVGSYYCAGGPYAPAWERDFPRLQAAGIDFFAQAWIDAHTRLMPWVGHAADFSDKEVARGLAHGALGSITCDWGDAGNYHLTGQTWLPFTYHGAVAWAGATIDRAYFDGAFTRLFYGLEDDSVARAMRLAGDISGDTVRVRGEDGALAEVPSNHFWEFFGDPFTHADITRLADPRAEGQRIAAKAGQAVALLEAALPRAARGADNLDQLLFGARSFAAMGRKLQVLGDLRDEAVPRDQVAAALDEVAHTYTALRDTFRALWLAEDRPNDMLEDHCRRFDWTIAACRQKAEELRN